MPSPRKKETPVEEAYKKVCFFLEKRFKENRLQFELDSPQSLTVKLRSGEYRKHPHIGGEKFMPQTAYLGKRGDLIIVFVPCAPTEYAFVEMTQAFAEEHLDGDPGFKVFLESLLAEFYDSQSEEVRSKVRAVDTVAEKKAAEGRYEENELFGSW